MPARPHHQPNSLPSPQTRWQPGPRPSLTAPLAAARRSSAGIRALHWALLATLLYSGAAHAAPDAGTGTGLGTGTGTDVGAISKAANHDPIIDLLGERGLLRPLGASSLVNSPLMSSVRKTVRDTASDLVMQAMNFLGVPYKRGGNTEASGFDCSGFTRHIFENSVGLVLPRRADEQATTAGLLSINRGELKPGDLVFFNTMKRTFSHVGIYVGDDKFIHSPRAGGEVRIEDMRESYWSRRFTGARRADLAAATPQLPTTR